MFKIHNPDTILEPLGLVVADLFRTEYLLEVEVIAARPAA